jgi:signal transduction histidine kinase
MDNKPQLEKVVLDDYLIIKSEDIRKGTNQVRENLVILFDPNTQDKHSYLNKSLAIIDNVVDTLQGEENLIGNFLKNIDDPYLAGLDNFVSYRAHETRNKFGFVRAAIELLYHDWNRLDQEKRGAMINSMNASLDMVLLSLDTSAKIFKGGFHSLDLDLARSNLNTTLDDAANAVEYMMKRDMLGRILINKSKDRNIEFEYDQYKVFNSTLNLLKNAVHNAYPNTEITLLSDVTKDICRVEILNYGNKIENPQSLFEWKKRAGNYKGRGVGLSICKALIESSYGKIGIENRIDNRTNNQICAWYELPLNPRIMSKVNN